MIAEMEAGRIEKERARIPHSRPTLGPEDEAALAAVVRSGMVRGGESLRAFESRIAAALGRTRAAAVTSGSAALHLALRAMGVGRGDRVAVPSYACVSLLQAVRRAGAEPIPLDCDPATFLVDIDDARRRIRAGARAAVVVDTFGAPADHEVFEEAGIPVVADAATSLGGSAGGRPAGSRGLCAISSFNANKMITTGGGGAVACDDPALMDRVFDLLDYDAREDPEVRYNERMGDLAAGLGAAQLDRLPSFVERRRAIAAIYAEGLSGLPVTLPAAARNASPAWHRYVIRVPGGSGAVRESLRRAGIDSPLPVHEPLHRILGLRGFPGAEAAHEEALSLPIFPSLADGDARRVVSEARRCISRR